ncbi:VPEID-CTERM sorting domain-containing protein [uncultured Roseovarius sp.]|uniref:VPEID-CTERM sorting domain-containing protein n=1 Tax=uncultured Roseovarius sp. TaxID=293344 RepID=UPI0025CF1B87|nr:VPEID-CTERM sorting domain-containing protein [uncultured Roseovarius sp.]
MKLLKTSVLASLAYASTSAMASAQSYSWWQSWFYSWSGGGSSSSGGSSSGTATASAVPEIDASTGVLAMAAVLATLALAWEIKRRRAQ